MSTGPLPPPPPRPRPQYGPPQAAPPPAYAPPTWQTAPPRPMYNPHPRQTGAAEHAALVRPWQVTFYGWLIVIGSIVSLVAILPLMFVNDATLISWWVELDNQADITVQNLDTARAIIIGADIVMVIIVGINLPLGIAMLRGSRGAYLYFCVMLWLNIAAVVFAIVVAVAVLVGGVMLFGVSTT
ncbi:hypothetical protein [Gordonia malaquae]|nr:hypothetical protein [Gordonia malaquae]